MIKINVPQGSEAWFEARMGRVTGTRFASLMMGDSTKGYNDLINTIVGEILTSEYEEEYHDSNMERGKDLEPEARELYESLFGEVEQVGFIIPDQDDPYHDWIGISPDGLMGEGGLEIKCPLRKTHLYYIEKGILPNEYKWQVQGALFVSQLKWWDFMSYYPNMKPFIIRVMPDLKMHMDIRTELEKVVGRIQAKIEAYNKYNYLT